MNLFKTLEKYQVKKNLRHHEEYFFYNEYRYMFLNIPMYRLFYYDIDDEFMLIRANIILRSLLNKKKIEEAVIYAYQQSSFNSKEANDYIKEKMINLPYLLEGNNKIYVPIFSRSINLIYSTNFGKLLKNPYSRLIDHYATSVIDLFDTYNFSLYNSLFSKLVPLYQDEKVLICYHYDFKTVYVINNEGRLDVKIALFDRYLKKPNYAHILERLKDVIDAYLASNREKFYNALIENGFISKRLIFKIKHQEYRFLKKMNKRARL